jgi:hypothetical protein
MELLTILSHHDQYHNSGKTYQFHHIGIIYRVNDISLLSDQIPEEKKVWLSISQIIPEELTPFAKQLWKNNFFRETKGICI